MPTCFGWLLDIVQEAVTAEVEQITANNIFARLTTALVGWLGREIAAAVEGS
jgi:hypothetical protein